MFYVPRPLWLALWEWSFVLFTTRDVLYEAEMIKVIQVQMTFVDKTKDTQTIERWGLKKKRIFSWFNSSWNVAFLKLIYMSTIMSQGTRAMVSCFTGWHDCHVMWLIPCQHDIPGDEMCPLLVLSLSKLFLHFENKKQLFYGSDWLERSTSRG